MKKKNVVAAAVVPSPEQIEPDAEPAGQDGSDGPPERSFPVVGIGASAGGLAAFEAFFRALPTDSGPDMAFVVVQHLAPDHPSILTDLLKRSRACPCSRWRTG